MGASSPGLSGDLLLSSAPLATSPPPPMALPGYPWLGPDLSPQGPLRLEPT